MPIRFKDEELDKLKELLKTFRPKALPMVDLLPIIGEIYEVIAYPIINFDDFIKKLDKERQIITNKGAEILVGGNIIKTDCLKDVIPPNYFPIKSKMDLQRKLTELYNNKVAQLEKSSQS